MTSLRTNLFDTSNRDNTITANRDVTVVPRISGPVDDLSIAHQHVSAFEALARAGQYCGAVE